MKFLDKDGRSWEPEVNVVTIGRVRDRLKINLLELLLPGSKLGDKLDDPCLLVDVIYLLCRDQADARDIDDLAFGKAMSMDSIEEAWSGVLEGLVLFSPRGLRPAHQKVLEKARKYQAATEAKIRAMVEQPEFETTLDRAIEQMMGQQASSPTESTGVVSSLPEPSESSQAGTPSPA